MATLETVIGIIQTAAGAVSGVKFAPPMPPEDASAFPFVVTIPDSFVGSWNTPEDYRTLYGIAVELHVSRQDLPVDVESILPYAESIPNAFLKALRDAGIANAGFTGTFGDLGWGATETFGYRWVIRDVKILTTIT